MSVIGSTTSAAVAPETYTSSVVAVTVKLNMSCCFELLLIVCITLSVSCWRVLSFLSVSVSTKLLVSSRTSLPLQVRVIRIGARTLVSGSSVSGSRVATVLRIGLSIYYVVYYAASLTASVTGGVSFLVSVSVKVMVLSIGLVVRC